ncbi:MAG: hypothetical protein K2O29_01350 [Ruminococcus sp.]|nr:hypothetical protein [Ruminococcus sp.]
MFDMKWAEVKKLIWKNGEKTPASYEFIQQALYDIMWYMKNNGDYPDEYNAEMQYIAEKLGDEELANEMMWQKDIIGNEAERLLTQLEDYEVSENFDNFFIATGGCDVGNDIMDDLDLNYDYIELDFYEIGLAEEEAQKRLQRLTKQEIIRTAHQCFKIFAEFSNVYRRYQNWLAIMNIVEDNQREFTATIEAIKKQYEKANDNLFCFGEETKKFDRLLHNLLDIVWVQ